MRSDNNMTLKDYEKELKSINENLNIKSSPQAPDMAGIYYQDIFITGIPNNNIYPERREDYKSDIGIVHKTSEVATAQINQWLGNIEEELELDKEFKEIMKDNKK